MGDEMCDICGTLPCHPRCPNAAYKICGKCDQCGRELYENEYYYTDNGGYIYCSEDCAIKSNGIKIVEEW